MGIKGTDWAWLAGFMDGDGCFTCAVWERKGSSGLKSITIAPRVLASQIAIGRRVLDRCVEITSAGKVYLKEENSNLFNSRQQATWTVAKLDEMKHVCENILPYVYHKKHQCETMLKLVDLRIKTKAGINRAQSERIPVEHTLECARLGLSLNPHATNGRNSQHNSENRTWEYWKKRIPEVYSEAEGIIAERRAELNLTLTCDVCGIDFHRYLSDQRPDSKYHYCSESCRKIGCQIHQYGEKVLILCTHCHSEIFRSPSSIRENNWCNPRCKKRNAKAKAKAKQLELAA